MPLHVAAHAGAGAQRRGHLAVARRASRTAHDGDRWQRGALPYRSVEISKFYLPGDVGVPRGMTLPVFETPRLTLRSITAHDADGLHEAYGDAGAMRHWDLPPSRDVPQTAERIRTSADADPRWHGMWAIQTHAGRFVGAINYHAHNA